MSKFEKFKPVSKESNQPPLNIMIREAIITDAPVMAMIKFNRDGGDLTTYTAEFENEITGNTPENRYLIVAEYEDKVVGFARATRFKHPDNPPADICPEGWYLTGVIVQSKYRRRKVAYQLTLKRLEWIAVHADSAYYFANSSNEVSIKLHRRFGFEEISRNFSYPGIEFEGGEGILFKVELIHLEQV